MKRAIIASFLAVLPLSVQAQPALNPEAIKDPVQRAEAWSRLLRAEREEHKREFPPPPVLEAGRHARVLREPEGNRARMAESVVSTTQTTITCTAAHASQFSMAATA